MSGHPQSAKSHHALLLPTRPHTKYTIPCFFVARQLQYQCKHTIRGVHGDTVWRETSPKTTRLRDYSPMGQRRAVLDDDLTPKRPMGQERERIVSKENTMKLKERLIETMKVTNNTSTTPLFWDCGCDKAYIRHEAEILCPLCGCYRFSQEDSRKLEVIDMVLAS